MSEPLQLYSFAPGAVPPLECMKASGEAPAADLLPVVITPEEAQQQAPAPAMPAVPDVQVRDGVAQLPQKRRSTRQTSG